MHIRNAPTRLMKQLGYADGYRYAHDEPEAYAAGERYLPDGVEPQGWYRPTPRGMEGKIAEKLASLAKLDAQAAKRQNPPEARLSEKNATTPLERKVVIAADSGE